MILTLSPNTIAGLLTGQNRFDLMDAKKNKRRNVFTFARTKNPKELASYLAGLLRQNKMIDESDSHLDRDIRRALRAALHSQDLHKFESLVKEGIDINSAVDNVHWETPLMYAVKHGHLELVERLLANHRCRLNCRDRNGHTALDEAVRMWLLGGGPTETKQHRGRRFRVLRSVVTTGADELTRCLLDNVVYSCQNCRSGMAAIDKFVKVVCQKGTPKLKTEVLSVLFSHGKMARYMRYLLTSGADPLCFADAVLLCHHIPEDNAVVMIKATNNEAVLRKVERYVRLPRVTYEHRSSAMPTNWPAARTPSGTNKPREVIRLLLLSSHSLNLQTMHYLRKHQAALYKMAATFICEPRPLKYLARVVVRKYCSPNVFAAVRQFKGVPLWVKTFLIFEEEDGELGNSRK